MSYKEALEAAGAHVIDYASFGSYQGDWFAIIDYRGSKEVVQGSFGSCSGCDAFEAEFDGYKTDLETEEEYKARLVQFGQGYLNSSISIEEAITYAQKNEDWDLETAGMIRWLKNLQNLQFATKLEDVIVSNDGEEGT